VPECGYASGVSDQCEAAGDALTAAFTLLGKRWTGLVLGVLTTGPAHFAELRRAIPGISERMLSDRLTELAQAGLVVREVIEGPPLGARYRVTEPGAALRPALEELSKWADRYLPTTGAPAAESRARKPPGQSVATG
jgi:DNA-binding HxlR family transcriptional regulator